MGLAPIQRSADESRDRRYQDAHLKLPESRHPMTGSPAVLSAGVLSFIQDEAEYDPVVVCWRSCGRSVNCISLAGCANSVAAEAVDAILPWRPVEGAAEFYVFRLDNHDVYSIRWRRRLAGVYGDVTRNWMFPYGLPRHPSLSYLYPQAEAMQEVKKPCYLYYFGTGP